MPPAAFVTLLPSRPRNTPSYREALMAPLLVTEPEAPVMNTPKLPPDTVPPCLLATVPPASKSTAAWSGAVEVMVPALVTEPGPALMTTPAPTPVMVADWLLVSVPDDSRTPMWPRPADGPGIRHRAGAPGDEHARPVDPDAGHVAAGIVGQLAAREHRDPVVPGPLDHAGVRGVARGALDAYAVLPRR